MLVRVRVLVPARESASEQAREACGNFTATEDLDGESPEPEVKRGFSFEGNELVVNANHRNAPVAELGHVRRDQGVAALGRIDEGERAQSRGAHEEESEEAPEEPSRPAAIFVLGAGRGGSRFRRESHRLGPRGA